MAKKRISPVDEILNDVRKNKNITIITPQFDREDGKKPMSAPKTKAEFVSLSKKPVSQLKKLGLQKWDDGGVWLFPREWYDKIPNGLEVVTISGTKEKFKKGVTDNDSRFGCLAYGVKIKK